MRNWDWRSVLLPPASLLAGLLLCEGALRLLPGLIERAAPPAGEAAAGTAAQRAAARNWAARMPLAPGTDLAWFDQDPPPLARGRVSPEDAARYSDFERRGLYAPKSLYVWNRNYLHRYFCDPGRGFGGFPAHGLVYDPPGGGEHPPYRFAPSSTQPSGLVTNRFGFRGPEIDVVKPPGVVRVAFVGASTTVDHHGYPYSYPERVVGWLNTFVRANRYDVRFEVLNAGREGISSPDIETVVRNEVGGLDPDLVVYYEGANQFAVLDLIARGFPGRGWLQHAWEWLASHSALADLATRAGRSASSEPRKPPHGIEWPAAVDEFHPDPDSPGLPLHLSRIVRDLDAIRADLRPGGGELVMCSFVWMVWDGMQLRPAAHRYIHRQLNRDFWPLRYSELRRLADFQNRVWRRWADSRQVGFIDVAGWMPRDPDLFEDAIHATDAGVRLKAWIVFQQLIPTVRRELDQGRLPRRAPPGTLPPLPPYRPVPAPLYCGM